MRKEIEEGVNVSEVLQRLERHPDAMARVARLLDALKNASGDILRADEAERRATEELRAMVQKVLRGWGAALARKESEKLEAGGGGVRQVKNSTEIGSKYVPGNCAIIFEHGIK